MNKIKGVDFPAHFPFITPMKFPVYSERPANTESVIPPLKEIFKGTNIRVTAFNSDDLRKGILRDKDTVGFCLPGIIGETSSYADQIGEYGLHEMSRAVKQGRVMLAVCAGAYFVSRETIYAPSWGPRKGRTPVNHLLAASARGPVENQGGQYDPSYWPSDLSLARIWYKSTTKPHDKDHWKHAGFAYGNGPALYLDNPQDPDVEPLAYYRDMPKNALAAASVKHGEGHIVLLGALPHIGYQEIDPFPKLKRIRNLLADMKPYEPDRQDFMQTVADRIHAQVLTYRSKFSI